MNREQINNLINTCQQEIRRLQEENKQLKEKLEISEKARKEALDIIKLKEYVIDLSTFGYDFNDCEIFKLKRILDIDKGE